MWRGAWTVMIYDIPKKLILSWNFSSPQYLHDDVIKWKHFPRYCPFVRGIHRSPVNSLHKGQWRRTLMFSLICAWTNGWANHRNAGDLWRHRVPYDVTIMYSVRLTPPWSAKIAKRVDKWEINSNPALSPSPCLQILEVVGKSLRTLLQCNTMINGNSYTITACNPLLFHPLLTGQSNAVWVLRNKISIHKFNISI